MIDLEYKLNGFLKSLIKKYNENNISYQNAFVVKSENKLIINNSDIVINNFDFYDLTEDDIIKLKQGLLSLPLDEDFYSLKGYLLLREFTEKEGYNFYDKFINSNLLKDAMSKL